MSDNIDKFVLQYVVETRDSHKRIEQLLQKQNEVDKANKKGASSMKMLGQSMKSLAGEASGAGEAAVGLSDSLMALGAATGPIAAVIAVVMLLKKALTETKAVMDELMQQRDLGARIGLSATSVENITRNMRRSPGSQVDQKGVNDLLEKIGTKLQNAYVDPTQMNSDAIALRQSGVNIDNKSGGINSTTSALDELQAKFKSVSDEQARGIGRVLGLTNQQVDAMRNLSGAMSDTNNMTVAEVNARLIALQKTEELNSAQNDLSEHWRELRDDLLVHVIPAIDTLVQAFDKLLKLAEEAGNATGGAVKHAWDFTKDHFAHAGRDMGDLLHGNFKAFFADTSKEWSESGEKIDDSAKAMLKNADKSAQETTQAQTEMQRIINMFSQSVNQFSNTIDERQAWAAWAGEIGRAAGLGQSGNKSLGLTGTGGNGAMFNSAVQSAAQMGISAAATGKSAADTHTYDDIFKAASAASGLPADLLKKVAMAESSLDPNAIGIIKQGKRKGQIGGMGLMQINPQNFKAYGITNAKDPTQNIMAGAKILAEDYKRFGNMDDALRAYNAGNDKANWNNSETAAYVGRVASQNATVNGYDFSKNPDLQNSQISSLQKYALDPKAKGFFSFSGQSLVNTGKGGDSREKSQLANIQNILAQQLGVPLAHLQTGGVSSGDLSYASSNVMAGLMNSRYALLNQMSVPGMTQATRGGLQTQLKTTDLQIQGMMRYMPQIQANTSPGDRNITIGQGAVQVIVQGANVTPEQLAKEINDNVNNKLGDHLNEVVNGNADAVAY